MMHVLHLHSGNLYGGVERLLATLAHYGRRQPELRQEFLLCFEGRIAEELRAAAAAVSVIGPARLGRPGSVARARRRLRDLLRARQLDVVIAHSAWAQIVFGPVARKAAVKSVFWQHSANRKRHWLEHIAARYPPDLLVANSHHTAAALAEREPHLARRVMYYPVAPPERRSERARRETREALGAGDESVVILQASRMEPWKGHRVLVEALATLNDLPDWTCWMAGGAQRPTELRYERQIRKLAAARGVGDRVRFLGHRSDVSALCHAADVFCQLNIEPEPFGIVFVEALYAGLPVVSSNLGGAAEIVDRSCGLLLDPGSSSQLAAALRALMTDANLRRRLGEGGPARARDLCDPMRQIDELRRILSDVCRDDGTGP